MLRSSLPFLAFAAACALDSGAACAAQNLLNNGDFSAAAQVSGWTPQIGSSGVIAFDAAVDADGTAGSGSMRLNNAKPNQSLLAGARCFTVAPGAAYRFGGKFSSDNTDTTTSTIALSCTAFTQADCSGELPMALPTPNGVTPVTFSGAHPFAALPESSGVLDGAARSVRCAVALNTLTSVSSPTSIVHVDDLYFDSDPPAPSSVKLDGYLSGNWYDPAQGGQGLQLEFTDQQDTLIAVWFVFAPDGSQNWIFAQGPYDPATNEVTVYGELLGGAQFPPQFDPASVQRALWGKLTFVFTDCNHAQLVWNGFLPGYGSGSMNLSRLTGIRGLSCPQ